LFFLLKHAQKNKTFNKHLTSKLQVSPNFTLDSVADSNYRGKCDVGGFLIFEWTLVGDDEEKLNIKKNLIKLFVFEIQISKFPLAFLFFLNFLNSVV
jgi:hypothetical protein